MNVFKVVIILFVLLSFFSTTLNSQTCSCAGNPSFNPYDLSFENNKRWHFEISYRFHAINDLVRGREKIINDISRKRSAQTIFLNTGYSISDKFSINTILSLIRQERNVGINNNPVDRTEGFGDSMISISYTPLNYTNNGKLKISIGSGIKIPTGRSDVVLTGIAAEDMQPGTGSWDELFWSSVSFKDLFLRSSELFIFSSFKNNGTNSREYKFGNEVTFSSGIKLYSGQKLNFSFHGRYIWRDGDSRFGGIVPNTGGEWISVVPGITYKFTPVSGIKANVEIPVFRDLNGTDQFTSTFLLSFSIFREI